MAKVYTSPSNFFYFDTEITCRIIDRTVFCFFLNVFCTPGALATEHDCRPKDFFFKTLMKTPKNFRSFKRFVRYHWKSTLIATYAGNIPVRVTTDLPYYFKYTVFTHTFITVAQYLYIRMYWATIITNTHHMVCMRDGPGAAAGNKTKKNLTK